MSVILFVTKQRYAYFDKYAVLLYDLVCRQYIFCRILDVPSLRLLDAKADFCSNLERFSLLHERISERFEIESRVAAIGNVFAPYT